MNRVIFFGILFLYIHLFAFHLISLSLSRFLLKFASNFCPLSLTRTLYFFSLFSINTFRLSHSFCPFFLFIVVHLVFSFYFFIQFLLYQYCLIFFFISFFLFFVFEFLLSLLSSQIACFFFINRKPFLFVLSNFLHFFNLLRFFLL